MEVLKHLAGQTITTDYVYDSNNPKSNEGTFDPSESALLIEEYRHDQVDIDMETRALVSFKLSLQPFFVESGFRNLTHCVPRSKLYKLLGSTIP